jgi:hypothetical protein
MSQYDEKIAVIRVPASLRFSTFNLYHPNRKDKGWLGQRYTGAALTLLKRMPG